MPRRATFLIAALLVSTLATAQTVTYHLSGTVTGEDGRIIAGARLNFYSSPQVIVYSDSSGAYSADFSSYPGAAVGPVGTENAFVFLAFVEPPNTDYESDSRYILDPNPSDGSSSRSVTQNIQLKRRTRINAGDSILVTISPNDAICINNVQDMHPWPTEFVCRTVRISVPNDGTVTAQAVSTDSSVTAGLETEWLSDYCCHEALENPRSFFVPAGTEVMAQVEMPWGTASTSFWLKTSFAPQIQQPWQVGFDFRATQAFVSDIAPNTYVLGASTLYPTTRNSATFGWSTTTQLQTRDRNSSLDPRLAGINFVPNNVAPATFRVDLPAAGTYNISLALGDYGYSQCASGCRIEFRDGATTLFVLTPLGIPQGMFVDANGSLWSAAAWPGSNTTRQVTMTGTTLTVLLGANSGQTDNTTLAYIGISQADSSSTQTGTISGTVTKASDKTAISGATVSYSGGSTTTNSSGSYALVNVVPGTYSVTASASGFQNSTQTNVSVTGGATTTVNFSLSSTVASPPPAPTWLTATAGNALVSLSWNDSSGATSYKIYRGIASGGETLLTSIGAPATYYGDVAVSNGTTYFYQVSAVNSAGESGRSPEASATPSGGSGCGAFTLTANPTTLALTRNSSKTSAISVSGSSCTLNFTVSVSSTLKGISASVNPTSASGGTTLAVSADGRHQTGSATVTVTATDPANSSNSASFPVTVTVN